MISDRIMFDRRYARYEFGLNKVDVTDEQNPFDSGVDSIVGYDIRTMSDLVPANAVKRFESMDGKIRNKKVMV